MEKPTAKDYSSLDQLLSVEAPNLRPIIRWLSLDPELACSLFETETREPTFGELGQLVRVVQRGAPGLMGALQLLVLRSDHAEVLHAEIQLDLLLAEDPAAWSHPVQVLERPRAPYDALLKACEQRLTEPLAEESTTERLDSVRQKLARAVRIATTAKRRRNQKALQQQREERRRQRLRAQGEPTS